ncbi:MAG: ATP-dependent helicase, partial [Chloroflexi bacterium]|nr:ATP-dependent helicase [Chloroflexota bacterium]
ESALLAQVLGRHGHFRVYGNGNGDAAIRKALESLGLDEGRWPLPRLHEYISQAKSQLLTPAEALQTAGARALDQHLARIYHAYEDALREANAVDYDDLLAWPLRLLYGDRDIQAYWREHCQHILVDEFQDTNSLQYELLRVLAEDHHSVTVVCSPAQSIYSWRGADGPLVLGHFQEDFDPAQVVLGQHYRCTQTILHAAQALIEGRGYGEQALATSNEPGGPITVAAATSGAAESRFIVQEIATLQAAGYAYRDMAILYRTRSQGRDLERVLLRAGIPYLLIGEQRFFRRPEVRHLLAYLRLAHDPQDDIALSRALAAPPCRVGERAKARELLVDRFDSIRLEGLREAQAKNLPDWLQAKLAEFLDFVTIDLPATNAGATASELVDYILGQPWYAAWLQAQNARERQQISLTTLRQLASHHDHLPPETSLAEFLAEIWDLEEYDLWDVPLDGDGGGVPADDPGAVILSTIHAAKGREYPVVFVAGFEDGLLPHTRSQGTARELEEERRLAYVALTRAQQYLYLSFAQERLQDDGQVTTHRPSRFLSHIPRELLTVQRVGG